MIAPLLLPGARLHALENVVEDTSVASASALVAASQPFVAVPVAPPIRGELKEVLRLADELRRLRVPRTLQLESWAEVIPIFENSNNIRPHLHRSGGVRVADDVHAVLGTRQEDIDPVRDVEESRLVLVVAADQRNDDDVCLFSLEVVNSCKPHGVQEARLCSCRGGCAHSNVRLGLIFGSLQLFQLYFITIADGDLEPGPKAVPKEPELLHIRNDNGYFAAGISSLPNKVCD